MALDWLKGGSTPQFWKNYTSLFEKEDGKAAKRRYVIFDMETSGLDYKDDVVLSIGAIGVTNNAIEIGDFFEVFIKQDRFASQSVALGDGLNETGHEKIVEAEALIQFLNFVKDAPLVSHNINLDVEMLNQALKRLDLGRIRNPLMDTNVLYQRWKDLPEDKHLTLDELCDALKVRRSDRHTASGNAYITAIIFLKLKARLGI